MARRINLGHLPFPCYDSDIADADLILTDDGRMLTVSVHWVEDGGDNGWPQATLAIHEYLDSWHERAAYECEADDDDPNASAGRRLFDSLTDDELVAIADGKRGFE